MSLPDDVGDKETLTTSARSRCPAGALSGGYRSVALGIGSLAWVWLLSGLGGSLAPTDGWFLALNGARRLPRGSRRGRGTVGEGTAVSGFVKDTNKYFFNDKQRDRRTNAHTLFAVC